MSNVPNPVDELIPVIANAIEEWKQKNTATEITKKVATHLDKSAEEILLKLLGFNKNWGSQWELDHCNGRAGNSTAGDFLKEIQGVAIKEWLQQVKLPEMPAALQKNLQAEMKHQYAKTLRYALENLVDRKVSQDAEALLKSITSSNQIDNYIKTLELINPETKQES